MEQWSQNNSPSSHYPNSLSDMMKRSISVVSLGFLLLSACVTTKEEGQQMRSDLRAVEQDLAVSRLEQKRKEEALEQRLVETEARMAKVSAALEKANQSTRKADADVYIKMDELVSKVRRMSGQLEEIDHRIGLLEQAQNTSAQAAVAENTAHSTAENVSAQPKNADPAQTQKNEQQGDLATDKLPADKRALYDLAKKSYDDKKFEQAREQFKVFLKRFPDDALLSDNAMFWTAESYYQQGTFDKAILSYQKVINKYPKSDKLDAALYKIGRAFESLGLKEDAMLFYQDLVSKFPKSRLLRDAKKRIRAAKGNKKRHR